MPPAMNGSGHDYPDRKPVRVFTFGRTSAEDGWKTCMPPLAASNEVLTAQEREYRAQFGLVDLNFARNARRFHVTEASSSLENETQRVLAIGKRLRAAERFHDDEERTYVGQMQDLGLFFGVVTGGHRLKRQLDSLSNVQHASVVTTDAESDGQGNADSGRDKRVSQATASSTVSRRSGVSRRVDRVSEEHMTDTVHECGGDAILDNYNLDDDEVLNEAAITPSSDPSNSTDTPQTLPNAAAAPQNSIVHDPSLAPLPTEEESAAPSEVQPPNAMPNNTAAPVPRASTTGDDTDEGEDDGFSSQDDIVELPPEATRGKRKKTNVEILAQLFQMLRNELSKNETSKRTLFASPFIICIQLLMFQFVSLLCLLS